jgi:predicted enzyme related to lactoylglutathione lyase
MRHHRSIRSLICIAVLSSFSLYGQVPSERTPDPVLLSQPKEKVLGIGGFFFKAKDPKALAGWYNDNFGIRLTPTTYEEEPWNQEAGPTVFAPFSRDTKYFGSEKNMWMINFRVRDMDAMIAQLRNNGIEATVDPEMYPNGRFARVYDPEGNPLQLWEPANGH